jgi:uncharacterized protein YecT (DUF1311 family)
VIHEQFTLLTCPSRPTTTIAIEGCQEHALVRSDRQIDARVKRIYGLLAPSARPGFARGERAWLAYRADVCRAVASKYAGGTIAPIEYGSCALARNTSHFSELADVLRSVSVH